MARIKKRGLDYFPLNTDFIHDRLVRRIMKREGDAALAVLVEVLSYIYADEGYYVRVDNLFYEDLSANLYEKSSGDVKRIVELAVEYGVFDSSLFDQYGILTSEDIQRQYLFSTKRRNLSQLEPAYCLLDSKELSVSQSKEGVSRPEKAAEKETGKELFEGINVTLIPENVTSGTHSIAQQSIAQNSIEQHSVAQHRKEYPLPNPPKEGTGGREGKEEIFSEKDGAERLHDAGRLHDSKRAHKRKEWSKEAIAELRPPTDGAARNYEGLLDSLRLYAIPPAEQYPIILKSNFGVIGGPVWKGIGAIRDSGGKIKLPGRYLLSVMNK